MCLAHSSFARSHCFLCFDSRVPRPARPNRRLQSLQPPSLSSSALAPGTTPGEPNAPATMPTIQRVIASSELKPTMYLGVLKHYSPNLAFDGDDTHGLGPKWQRTRRMDRSLFPSEDDHHERLGLRRLRRRFSAIRNKQSRPRAAHEFPEWFLQSSPLADKMQLQRFDLPRHPVVDSIKFEIISVYRERNTIPRRSRKSRSTGLRQIKRGLANSRYIDLGGRWLWLKSGRTG